MNFWRADYNILFSNVKDININGIPVFLQVQKDALTYPDGAWSGVQNEFATALERSTGRGWRVGVWRWIWGRGPREGPFPGDYGHVRGVRNGMVRYGITTQRSDNNDGENNCNSGKQELARHALDTWSAQGAKDSRYLEGLPSCRAAGLPRSPAETSRIPGTGTQSRARTSVVV